MSKPPRAHFQLSLFDDENPDNAIEANDVAAESAAPVATKQTTQKTVAKKPAAKKTVAKKPALKKRPKQADKTKATKKKAAETSTAKTASPTQPIGSSRIDQPAPVIDLVNTRVDTISAEVEELVHLTIEPSVTAEVDLPPTDAALAENNAPQLTTEIQRIDDPQGDTRPIHQDTDFPVDDHYVDELSTADAVVARDAGQAGFAPSTALAPRLVRASAGTGKTYQLTARLLKILLQGAPPESVLATTFTRKAAGEILNRVLLTLANAANEHDDAALEALRQQVGIPTLPRRVCHQLLDTLLRNIHRLRICTLDSLFAQLARSFPFELGLPPAWRLTDEIEEVWLRERAIAAVISTLDPSEMMTLLSMLGKGDAKRSIAFELTQVVDSAYSLQRQCDHEVWNQLRATKLPESADLTRIAGMFRQANPPQKSLRKKLDLMADAIELRQFDSLAKETLIINIDKARRSGDEVKLGRSKFPPGLEEAFDVLYDAARSATLSLLQAQNEATGNVLAAYDQQITQLKNGARALGFDDVAVRLADQFRCVDHQSLASRMDGAIDHVLLDEFQDTSPIQWQVLRPLAMRAASQEDSSRPSRDWQVDRSFFCVGDTKQAIYGWRGGVAEIFDAVADQIDGVEEVEQNESFRSSQVVLDVVDQTFKNLGQHRITDAAGARDLTSKATYEGDAALTFSRRFPSHVANKQELPGYVRFETARKIDGDVKSQRAACFEDAAKLIADLHHQAPHKSIGVLTRTNSAVANLIFQLDSMDVDVSQEGGNPLTDSAAVDVVLSALMMADHPSDGRWAFHVHSTPLGSLLGKDAAARVRHLTEDRGLSETIEYLADELAPQCDARDTLRLQQLTQLAMTYQQNQAPRLRDFVDLVRSKRVERPQAAPVRVMTVHQAKGLEFDAVVLPELDGRLTRAGGGCVADTPELGQPPSGMSRAVNKLQWHFLPERWQKAFGGRVAGEITEAMCLLYVAMTRPRQALHMIIPPATKAEFTNKNFGSLIYHSLECEDDPSQSSSLLFEAGDPNWFAADAHEGPSSPTEAEPVVNKTIQFQPLPPVPRRNRND